MQDLERRIENLETWKDKAIEPWRERVDDRFGEISTAREVDKERRRHMDAQFNRLEGRLDKIDGHIAKLVWLVIGAIVTGFMAFVIGGGLNAIGG